MPRKGRCQNLTLTQTILGLVQTEPLFANVDIEKIKEHGAEYYEREQKKLGEYLVMKGDVTSSMIELARAKQEEAAGNLELALEHTRKSLQDAHSHGISLTEELRDAVASFEELVGKWMAYAGAEVDGDK